MSKVGLLSYQLSKRIDDLSKTKWNKLLFLIDIMAYNSPKLDNISNLYSGPITEKEYIKMPYGPVVKNFDDEIDQLVGTYIKKNIVLAPAFGYLTYLKPVNEYNLDEKYHKIFIEEEKKIIESIITKFINATAKSLSDWSHKLSPWKESSMFDTINLELSRKDDYIQSITGKNNLYDCFFQKQLN